MGCKVFAECVKILGDFYGEMWELKIFREECTSLCIYIYIYIYIFIYLFTYIYIGLFRDPYVSGGFDESYLEF